MSQKQKEASVKRLRKISMIKRLGILLITGLCIIVWNDLCSAALINKSAWMLVYVDSEEIAGEDGVAENAYDGSPSTLWHTAWSSASPAPPHEIRIDIGTQYSLTGFRYLPRQDGGSNGRIGQYEFYVSTDGVNWGSPVATGTFANNASEKEVLFTPKTGKFVRLRALTEVNGNPWTSMAELSLLDGSTTGNPVTFVPEWTDIPSGPFNVIKSPQVVNPVLTARDVTDVPATFVADPFLFHENGIWYMFFEVLRSDSGRGVIGVAQSYDGYVWQYKQIVLSETFHLSFPLVFKANDKFYMIPETNEKSEVRLYEATNFPYNWTYAGTLFSGRNFVDPQIFRYNDMWWVFVSDTSASECYLYYSSDLTSGWKEHPASPVVRQDTTKARGGGRSFVYNNNRIIRTAQKNDTVFTQKVRAFEVDLLTDQQYAEHEIPESPLIKSGQEDWNRGGAHSFDPWWDGTRWICVTDGQIGDGIWTIGIYIAQQDSAPNGKIDYPVSDVTIPVGGQVNFTGTGSDSDGDLPLRFLWQFGAGSGVADKSIEDPGSVQFNSPGIFTVTFTVTDAKGISDPTPDSRTITVTSASNLIPKSNFVLAYVDSEELVGEDGVAENAFDGSPSTLWHTAWSSASTAPPHEIRIDLSTQYSLTGFRYLPRQDGGSNGRIGQYEFYVSTDGVNWGSPVATGTFANNASEKEVLFTPKTGKFVRLRALTEVNGNPWTSMAELSLIGSPSTPGNQAPNGSIDSPSSDVSIKVGETVAFAGSGSDPDGNLPLQFLWQFGAGSGIPDSSVKDPGIVQFPNPGVFTVTLTVTDAKGYADPTPSTRKVTVSYSGASLIPKSGWVLRYFDSQEVVGEDGAAENAFDGDPLTIWHTAWRFENPPPPHEIQIDLGTQYRIEAFRYLPRQDGGVNGRIGQYEFYVSTDGINWGSPVITGVFANDSTEKQVALTTPKAGQFVRFKVLNEINGNPWTSIAEISLIGALN